MEGGVETLANGGEEAHVRVLRVRFVVLEEVDKAGEELCGEESVRALNDDLEQQAASQRTIFF